MVDLKPGYLVRMDYVLYRSSDNSVVDTTMEEVAKKGGIYDPKYPYAPRLVVYGMGRMVGGLEEQLPSLELGVKKDIIVPCAKAFGEKKKDLLRVLAVSDFLKQNVRPQKGMGVSLDGNVGTIKSVDSGRVVVDFNHPLSGEDLHYSITLLETISQPKKKLEAILSAAKIDARVEQKGDSFDVEFNKENPSEQEIALANAAISAISPNARIKVKEEEVAPKAGSVQEGKSAQEESQKLHSKLASKKAPAKPAAQNKKN